MGDNNYLGDRNSVRTPMQWNGDGNAGFSQADPERLYFPLIQNPVYSYQAINVEVQLRVPTSLLHWIKRLIACHKRYPVSGHLTLNVLHPANQAVLAYLRSSPAETIFVVNNLSRFVQPVELDLSTYEGAVPIEIIGHTRFPPIGPQSYFLSLGPHGFYWFRLDRAEPPSGHTVAVNPQGRGCRKQRCPSTAHTISLCRTSGFPYSSSLR